MKRLISVICLLLLLVSGGASAYENVTIFSYNITTGMGPQTNYQMKFILSNASGISGYYAPDNVIFTNGTTRPDWADIQPTTGLDMQVPFWVEEGTQTQYNTSVWVNVPRIAVENTSTGKWYYGNASQTSNLQNGYSTFVFFDDFNGGTLNTSQWGAATGNFVIANGEANARNTATSTKQGIKTLSTFGPTNTSFITRAKETATGVETYHDIGFDAWGNNFVTITYNHAVGGNSVYGQNSNDGTHFSNTVLKTIGDTSYHTYYIKWIAAQAAYRMDSNNTYNVISTYVPTTAINVTLRPFTVSGTYYNITADWVAVGNIVSVEPITSGYSTKINSVPNVIYDTDIASDVDDVGALAMLNNMSRSGEIHLSAVITDSENIYSAPCAYAINKFYGHQSIPIGAYKGIVPGGAAASTSLYTYYITNTFGIPGDTYANYSNSTTVYRQVLAGSQNDSVTIVVGGYYGPTAELLRSPADSISPLTGTELVRQKVTKLVSTAGFYPQSSPADSQGGAEWNFKQDPYNASYVFANWPTQIVSVGIELGDTIYTAPPSTEDKFTSPIRAAYNMSIGNSLRQSWDQLGALYGSQNLGTNFYVIGSNGCTTVTAADGNNAWTQTPQAKRSYLGKSASDATLVYQINSSMLDPSTVEPTAFFTCTPTSTTLGTAITCTDASDNNPTNWTYYWGDGNVTDGTQNPSYTYPFTGTFSINQTVNNTLGSSWYNRSNYITITNVSGFTQQDLWQTGHYTKTLHITDSATNAPIPVVVVTDSNGQSYTTTNGTAYFTEDAGAVVFYFAATGYVSKSMSYIIDGDSTDTVQMVASSGAPQQNTWYTPWQVRIRILDYYGAPLPNINVTANYIASSLPSTDTTWLVSAFGINTNVANDMLDSSVAMAGNTDDNGGLSFTMFKSIQYRLTITNSTLSVASTKTLYPSDQEYVIYVRTAGQTVANNTLAMRNGTLPWYSVNSTHINLNMTYVDTSLCTSQLVFRVWFRDNGTEVHNTTWSGFGADYVYDNHTVPKAPIGTEYLWGYNATTVC